jgi:hypothetical protein
LGLEGFIKRFIAPTHFTQGFHSIVAHLFLQGAEVKLLEDHRNGFGWVRMGCVFGGVSRAFHAILSFKNIVSGHFKPS